MADKRLTQSPRAMRESTNDPEAYARGEVELGMNDPQKSGGPENESAWQHQGDLNHRDEAGWPSGIA